MNLEIYDFGSAGGASGCDRATAPIHGDWSVIFNGPTAMGAGDETGAAPANVVTLAAGAPAYNGAIIRNKSCKPVRVDFTVLVGEDCDDECTTVDQLSAEVHSVYVDAKSGKKVDIGFWQQADVVVLDVNGSSGVPTNIAEVGLTAMVEVDTMYRPKCTSCIKYAI
ncbi:MAG TPA: hypothetical protein PLB10_18830 [Thiolinea sp.]|nr:hypothetical protein [Thiolinea sp.]